MSWPEGVARGVPCAVCTLKHALCTVFSIARRASVRFTVELCVYSTRSSRPEAEPLSVAVVLTVTLTVLYAVTCLFTNRRVRTQE
jgi:hypothetical protein